MKIQKSTLETLLEMGIIPIVNANDTISTYEIEISDNDRLSAMVAEIIHADLLLLLTDIDALYDKDPRNNPDARRVAHVAAVTDEIRAMAGEKKWLGIQRRRHENKAAGGRHLPCGKCKNGNR